MGQAITYLFTEQRHQHAAAAQGKCSPSARSYAPLVDGDSMCRCSQGAGCNALQDLLFTLADAEASACAAVVASALAMAEATAVPTV